MKLKKVGAMEYQCHCNSCGKDFVTYHLYGFRYGEGFFLTEDGSRSVYINYFEDEVQEEFDYLLKRLFIFRKMSGTGDEFRHTFGICCDKLDGKKIDSSRVRNTCYYCASEDINIIEDLEYKEVICPVVTHNEWNKLDKKAKKELIRKELKRRNFL